MGIQGYFSFIRRTFRENVVDVDLRSRPGPDPWNRGSVPRWEPDDVYFDVNNLMYNVAGRATNDDHYFVLLFKQLDRINFAYRAKRNIFLGLDGPGPRAKIPTQRARRILNMDLNSTQAIDTLGFTPGSVFMQKLKDALCFYAANRISTLDAWENVSMVVSAADRIGEGEMKIFQYMKCSSPESRALVIGNDADLILYGLLSNRDVRILRLDVNDTFINVPGLRKQITNQLADLDPQLVVKDFVALSLLNGNDYFPKLNSFNFAHTWARYLQLKRSDAFRDQWFYTPDDGIVNMDMVEALFEGDVPRTTDGVWSPRGILMQLFQSYVAVPQPSFYARPLASGDFVAQVWVGQGNSVNGVRQAQSPDDEERAGRILAGTGMGPSMRAAEVEAARAALSTSQVKDMCLEHAKLLPEETEPIRARMLVATVFDLVAQGKAVNFESLLPAMSLAEVPTDQLRTQLEVYIAGIGWVMEYFHGNCADYNYIYPWLRSPTSLIPSVALRDLPTEERVIERVVPRDPFSRPQAPAEFGLTLTPVQARHLLPSELGKLMEEGSPIHDLWNSSTPSRENWMAHNLPDTLDRISQAVRDAPFADRLAAGTKPNAPSVRFRRDHQGLLSGKDWRMRLPPAPGDHPMFKQGAKYPVVAELEHFTRTRGLDADVKKRHFLENTAGLNLEGRWWLGGPRSNPFIEHVGGQPKMQQVGGQTKMQQRANNTVQRRSFMDVPAFARLTVHHPHAGHSVSARAGLAALRCLRR